MKKNNIALSVVLKLLFSSIIVFALFYIFLPPINPLHAGFWIFLAVALAIYTIPFCISSFKNAYNVQYTANKMNISVKRTGKKTSIGVKAAMCAVFLPIVIVLIGEISSLTFFNAQRYANIITVNDADFATDMPETENITNIALMDSESATIIGNRALGSLSDVVSQYVSSGSYTQINYQGYPKKVANLEYDGFFKWLGNRADGVPGYIMVDPVGNTADYKKLSAPLKYVNSAYFGEDLYRKLRFSYPTKIFGNVVFEIDENGDPFFIVSCMKPRVGMFGAYDVDEVIIFDPCDGSSERYAKGEIPRWVDIVYDGDLAETKYNWHGTLSGGFWNSVIGNKGCKQTTDDFGYLMHDDDVWYYTGVTSVTNDASNIGFILSNARTGEYKYYSVVGAEEHSAMSAAEGEVQEKGYKASFPALINVSGKATYIMVLKDDSGLVKLYALVNVEQYSIVATGETQAQVLSAYRKLLAQNGIEGTEPEKDNANIIVKEIEKLVIDGNSQWYLLGDDGNYYRINIADNESALFIRTGDRLKVSFAETENSGIRSVISWEKE